MKRERHIDTGHRDCCGQAVRRGDKVATASGNGIVLWVGKAWRILYEDRHLEPLNAYDKSHIRCVDNSEKQVDNGLDNKNAFSGQ